MTSFPAAWLLDLDNTLYSARTGFFQRVDLKITEYMEAVVGIPPPEVADLRRRYRSEYGVTLVGLMKEYSVDPEDYLPYVHDVEIEDLVQPDGDLLRVLKNLRGSKFIFTNGSLSHAVRVLDRLGVGSEISGIFDIAFMDYLPKPDPHGYRKVLERLGLRAGECIMADDSLVNLETAKTLGMRTVLVGSGQKPGHLYAPTALTLQDLEL